ncbi:hypothetical protein SAMN05878503_102357 [Cereibacter ovatus]|uniref:Uncharacterized protein n=1 Tax=Cereibacter ovatus TaxID=439529 RepID=A0A285CN06_9RHOB|nr:DUF6478 family protein [Cereibacter ovatus]SNX68917.1 hypothetical protein SAMN05878503_102357 [Cereibacter ovatus]
MGRRFDTVIDRLVHRAALRRWRRAADAAAAAVDPATLRLLRGRGRALRRQIDRLLHVAEDRLRLPMIGSTAMRRPLGTDWSWRPDLWRLPAPLPGMAPAPPRAEIAPGATLFHDCRDSEITLRQIRTTGEADLAPYGLRIEVFGFDGRFLSLVLDLPDAAAQGLQKRHLIRLETALDLERPMRIYARLNVRHGPNTEQIVRELPPGEVAPVVEFDLGYTAIDEARVDRLWLDLIFDAPRMNRVLLRDLTLGRRPRAEV